MWFYCSLLSWSPLSWSPLSWSPSGVTSPSWTRRKPSTHSRRKLSSTNFESKNLVLVSDTRKSCCLSLRLAKCVIIPRPTLFVGLYLFAQCHACIVVLSHVKEVLITQLCVENHTIELLYACITK